MKTWLEIFAKNMTMLWQLRLYGRRLYDGKEPPHAYESYAHGLQQCLQPFIDFIIATEATVRQQDLTKCHSINWLMQQLEPQFKYLRNLFGIHTACILDHRHVVAHICTTHLYASLLRECTNAPNVDYANLCVAIFICTIRVYFFIIDKWWFNGYLEDYRNEFILKK